MQSATSNPDTFSQRLTNISKFSPSDSQSKQDITATTDKYKSSVKIKNVFLRDEQMVANLQQQSTQVPNEEGDWQSLRELGISEHDITRFKKKVNKQQRIPIAKL